MSVVAAPAATVLAVSVEVAPETLVASILAGLVALSSSLVRSGSKTAILTAGLGSMESMALEVARVSPITGLLRLSRGKGRTWSSVCG